MILNEDLALARIALNPRSCGVMHPSFAVFQWNHWRLGTGRSLSRFREMYTEIGGRRHRFVWESVVIRFLSTKKNWTFTLSDSSELEKICSRVLLSENKHRNKTGGLGRWACGYCLIHDLMETLTRCIFLMAFGYNIHNPLQNFPAVQWNWRLTCELCYMIKWDCQCNIN